jgi:DNA helicase HerA-like ATPase
MPSESSETTVLGQVEPDRPGIANERLLFRMPAGQSEFRRNQWVRVQDPSGAGKDYLGRIVSGPFFPAGEKAAALMGEIELEGELREGRVLDAVSRPATGAIVHALPDAEMATLLGCSGDMLMGQLAGQETINVQMRSKDKGVLPRNVGVFGTVGSGKSNTAQVLIEEAALNGWAVVVLDVEGEYTVMDSPSDEVALFGQQGPRPARGLSDFKVFHPASCAGDRESSEPFTLRLADFESAMIAEFLQATVPERNALVESIAYFEHHAGMTIQTNANEHLAALLNANAKLPFNVGKLKERAVERGPRSTEHLDYVGLVSKLQRLMETGAFDQPNTPVLDTGQLTRPGRVSVIDVSVASDTVRNLVTADLLRKLFAYKITKPEAAPTLLVIEEAHTFISRDRVHIMQATLQMLRDVSRRGRKRWLSLAFVSQQPAHLPQEIFELCNTRFVHGLRSTQNLQALMTTGGDVGQELWDHCPLLRPGEAIVSSPQFRRPFLLKIRPASSRRKFTR